MMWASDSSGREAFDFVSAKFRAWAGQCDGLKRWDKFLRKHPEATLGECLAEFERQSKSHPTRTNWALALLEAFGGDVYPEFRASILARMNGDTAATVLAGHDLTDGERAMLDKAACNCPHRRVAKRANIQGVRSKTFKGGDHGLR